MQKLGNMVELDSEDEFGNRRGGDRRSRATGSYLVPLPILSVQVGGDLDGVAFPDSLQ